MPAYEKPPARPVDIYYILYFSEDLTAFDDEYYKGFVDFFVDIEDDEKIYSSLNEYSPSAIGELNKKAYV